MTEYLTCRLSSENRRRKKNLIFIMFRFRPKVDDFFFVPSNFLIYPLMNTLLEDLI